MGLGTQLIKVMSATTTLTLRIIIRILGSDRRGWSPCVKAKAILYGNFVQYYLLMDFPKYSKVPVKAIKDMIYLVLKL